MIEATGGVAVELILFASPFDILLGSCWLRHQGPSEFLDTLVELRSDNVRIIRVGEEGEAMGLALIRLNSRPTNRNGAVIDGMNLDETSAPLGFRRKVALVSAIQRTADRKMALNNYTLEPLVQVCHPNHEAKARLFGEIAG